MKRKQLLPNRSLAVIPALAGIHSSQKLSRNPKLARMPAAFAGMTPDWRDWNSYVGGPASAVERPR
jgi:hypothetical protein